jgi:hypothetical protein
MVAPWSRWSQLCDDTDVTNDRGPACAADTYACGVQGSSDERTESGPEAGLSVAEVARLLDVHRATVHRIPGDQLPYTEVGRRKLRRYRRSDVEAYRADTTAPSLAVLIEGVARHDAQLARHELRISALETELGTEGVSRS